jgi:hypothetical protein
MMASLSSAQAELLLSAMPGAKQQEDPEIKLDDNMIW